MKRFGGILSADLRYQWRYGFYFIYAFLVVMFVVILRLLPADWRQTGLALVLLSDPMLLGFFFIGGILQLERGEGLLDALFVSPLSPWEYLVSKAVSLGLLSAASGCLIALLCGVSGIQYGLLAPAMLLGSACFTLIGVAISVNLTHMNAYLSVNGLWEALLIIPPMLLILGVSFPPLEAFPGSLMLRLTQAAVGAARFQAWMVSGMAAWLLAAAAIADKRLNAALSRLGGGA